MNSRLLKLVGVAAVLGAAAVVVWLYRTRPRTRDLGHGYAYVYFPAGGHRYIVTKPGGIKTVGQEVLEYRVTGNVITGKVRLALGGEDIRAFTIDTTSNIVTLAPALD